MGVFHQITSIYQADKAGSSLYISSERLKCTASIYSSELRIFKMVNAGQIMILCLFD